LISLGRCSGEQLSLPIKNSRCEFIAGVIASRKTGAKGGMDA
jgi:hypothetical protein